MKAASRRRRNRERRRLNRRRSKPLYRFTDADRAVMALLVEKLEVQPFVSPLYDAAWSEAQP